MGVVKRIMEYGVFVDIGGLEGLLHISEMSWKRIKHPAEIFKLGDQIEVDVLKFDREKNRISLGFRRAEEDPVADRWRDLPRRLHCARSGEEG